MKTTFVSSLAMQNSMRLTIAKAQAEVIKGQQEIDTGKHADFGLALGARTGNNIALNSDVNRMQAIIDANALVNQRLSTAQQGLSQMEQSGQSVLNALISSASTQSTSQIQIAQETIRSAMSSFLGAVNISANGEYLFAGTNTDQKPVTDYFDPAGSPAKAAFDNAFQTYFGFAQTDPQVSTVTATQMDDFLTNVVQPMYDGAAWNTDWSSASDTTLQNRISKSEVVQSSVTANGEGMRNFAFASVISVELLDKGFDADVLRVVNSKATAAAGQAIAGINANRATLGVSQARVKQANDALQSQIDIVSKNIGSFEDIDVYEASTRMTTMLTQLETSYSLTARIQQLSLMNYL